MEYKNSKVAYISTTRISTEGEIISESVYKPRSKNGSGFVISYTNKICEFLRKCSSASVVRLFMFVAHNQQWGQGDVWGYRCTRKHLSILLNLNRKTVYEAIEWLTVNEMIVETSEGHMREIMVNPLYITCGADRSARVREWQRRVSATRSKEV